MQDLKLGDIEDRVHIAILTFKQEEFDAVLKKLGPTARVPGPSRSYAYADVSTPDGPIGVALTRCTEQGEGYAQSAARTVIADLHPPWLFVVGIAGAVPDDDYTLGDVVVARKHYDMTRTKRPEGGGTTYAVTTRGMHSDVNRLLQCLPGLYPELEEWKTGDSIGVPRPILSVPKTIDDSSLVGDQAWKERVMGCLDHAFGSGHQRSAPEVRVAPSAGANALVRDPKVLQEWLQSAGDIAVVEMEHGGVLIAADDARESECRVVAIRGISDIVGFKRTDEWTDYACNTAASFACVLAKSGLTTGSLPDSESRSPDPVGPTAGEVPGWIRKINSYYGEHALIRCRCREAPRIMLLPSPGPTPGMSVSDTHDHAMLTDDPVWGSEPLVLRAQGISYSDVSALRRKGKRPRLLSGSAVIICSELKEVILNERSRDCATYGGCIHTFGGAYRPPVPWRRNDGTRLLHTVLNKVQDETQLSLQLSVQRDCPPMILMEEPQTGFVQLTVLGAAVSAEEKAALECDSRQGYEVGMPFDGLPDLLREPIAEAPDPLPQGERRWVPTGKASVLAWLALGAPGAGPNPTFGDFTAHQLFEDIVGS